MNDALGKEIKIGDTLLWFPYAGNAKKVTVVEMRSRTFKTWDKQVSTSQTISVLRPHHWREGATSRCTLRNPNRVVVVTP